MTATTIDIETVCTHQNLVDEVHSARALNLLLPSDAAGSSTAIRTLALNDTMRALKRRMPPILAADLEDVTELSQAVLYGTLMRLEFAALTGANETDVHWAKYKRYRDLYDAEIDGLTPTLSGGSTGAPMSISTERR